MNKAIIYFGLTLLVVAAQGCSTKQVEPKKSTLDIAINGLGGAEILKGLHGYSIQSERDEYIMGQGPEPGKGMMLLAAPSTRVSHQLASQTIKIDLITTLARREGGYITREISTLLVGEAGYLREDDAMGIVKERDKILTSDKAAAYIKTERLLNPHLLLKEVLSDPSLLLDEKIQINAQRGWRFAESEVMPVTIDRLRQTGLRTLIATQEWENESSKKKFYPKMINKTVINPNWLTDWQNNTVINEVDYQQFSIEDKLHPITFFVDPETGRIDKLSTMEWDVVYGDIEVEVTFHDWQVFNSIAYPMTVRMSLGGAPRWEIRRSTVEVNPNYAENLFTPSSGLNYIHDQDAAKRGWEISQSIRMFTLSGAYRPELNVIEIDAGVHYLSALPIDGIYTMVIEQDNGVVVVEPGMNDLKGEEIIKWIKTNIPNKPLTHLVVTHHHNDHGAGIRPYIAEGTALVVHETAEEFYRAQINRPKSSVVVDALDRTIRDGMEVIIGVSPSAGYTINDSKRPVTVYPVFNGHSEDMAVAFLAKQNMLYAGDLYISGVARDKRSGTIRGPNVVPYHSAISLNDTIKQFNLSADNLLGSHDKDIVSYQDLVDYITD
jgi:glyoxylase-like metal-dependent hydrolase (beta-lactamase superfamily II)